MKLTSNVSGHEWKILFLALAMISSCWIIVLYVFFDWYIPYLDIFLDYQKWSAENNHLVEFRNHIINNNNGIETNGEFRDLIILYILLYSGAAVLPFIILIWLALKATDLIHWIFHKCSKTFVQFYERDDIHFYWNGKIIKWTEPKYKSKKDK